MKKYWALGIVAALVFTIYSCQTTQVAKEPPSPPLVKKTDTPESMKVISQDIGQFPYLSMQFQLLGKNDRPITNLSQDDVSIHFISPSDLRVSAQETSLTDYFPAAGPRRSGAVRLEKPDSARNNLYLFTWYDANWNPAVTNRSYRIDIEIDSYHFTDDITVLLDNSMLQSWVAKEMDAALSAIKQGGASDRIILALQNRYKTEYLLDFYKKLHEYIMTSLVGKDLLAAADWLEKLDALLPENETWQKQFQADYAELGNRSLLAKNYSQAIEFLQKSLDYLESQSIYEQLLDAQLAIYDFSNASQSIEWLERAGRYSKGLETLAWKKIQTDAGLWTFARAENQVKARMAKLPPSDSRWGSLFLLWKAYWYGGAAQSVALGMKNSSTENQWKNLTTDIQDAGDIRWIGWANKDGLIIYSTDDKQKGKSLISIIKNLQVPLSHPLYIETTESDRSIGNLLVPVTNGIAILSYDNQLITLQEQQKMIALKKDAGNPQVWSAARELFANRCGRYMMLTVGNLLAQMKLQYRDWHETARFMDAIVSHELLKYVVVAGRNKPGEAIRALTVIPGNLSPAITQNEKANVNPQFYYEVNEISGKSVYEMGTGVYSGTEWLGALRFGFGWN